MLRQLAMAILLPFAGKFIYRVNIRIIISGAMLVFSGIYIFLACIHNIKIWFVAGIIQGMASSFLCYLPIPILINNWFENRRGLALGIASAFTGIGGGLFTPLGAWIIGNYGWRTGIIVLSISSLLIMLPFSLFVIRFKPSEMGLKPYQKACKIRLPENGNVNSAEITIDRAIKSSSLYCLLLIGGLLAFGYQMIPHLPGYTVSIGHNSMAGGAVISFSMSGIITGKIILGLINDKYGIKAASGTGTFVSLIGILCFLSGIGLNILFTGAFLFGFGLSMLNLIVPLLVRKTFGTGNYGIIYSWVAIPQALLGSAGVFLFGFLYDRMKSYKINFVIVGVAYIITFFLIMNVLHVFSGKEQLNYGKY
jgi:MFS family permease